MTNLTTTTKPTTTARKRLLESLAPKERWLPSEWAERERILSPEESESPGPYRFDKTPYWRFVIDATVRPGVEEIVCIKGAQIGWSELCRNAMGYWIDFDPGPILVLAPDEDSAKAFRDERIEPLMKYTPAVRRHKSKRAWDSKKTRIKFDTCSVFFTWSGSKTGTKTRPIRRLIAEEPDEYQKFSGGGGDPLSKAIKRLATFRSTGRSTALIGGTPTTRSGNIAKRWALCSAKYHFWVPCIQCGGYQRLLWKNVKWPKLDLPDRAKRAERILVDNLAYYECEHCKTQLRDHDKARMLLKGVWATEDQVVLIDGRIVGPEPRAKRLGFEINSLYSPYVRFSELAAAFLECQGDPHALADFVNQYLAEVFEEQREKIEPNVIARKAMAAPPPMVVPPWTRWLLATADTQGVDEQTGYFWYVIRAWGCNYRSQLIDFGVAHSKEELVERCLHRQIPIEGGGSIAPSKLFIDSRGRRTQEVYQLAQGNSQIFPSAGATKSQGMMVSERPQKGHNVVLWYIDTEQAKDHLSRLIADNDRSRWQPHSEVIDQASARIDLDGAAQASDYCRQMSSEAKIFDPTSGREVWVEIVKDNNHLWDCETLQAAAAWRLGAGAPEPEPEPDLPAAPQHPVQEQSTWATGHLGRY